MRRFLYVVLLTVFFSFLWGVWWGFAPKEDPITWLKSETTFKVLTPKGVFPQGFLENFQSQEDINFQLTEIDSSIELLREILSSSDKYDLIFYSSFLADSLIFDHYFQDLGPKSEVLLEKLSVDFLRLKFDPENRYSIPLLWGVNGWLLPRESSDADFQLLSRIEELRSSESLAILPNPAELFGLVTKLKPIIRTWVETGQSEKLLGEKSFFRKFSFEASDKGLRQISSGALTEDLLEEYEFRLASERSHLWIISGAISKGSENPQAALGALARLLDPEWSARWANESSMATVVKELNGSEALPPYRQARFIRELPLSQIELFSSHEAYGPIFMSILQKTFPQFSKE